MFVHQILKRKGSDIVSAKPTASLFELASMMAKKRIGAVLILGDDAGIAGIVSERDITCCLAEHGADTLAMSANQVMTRDVVTCSPGDGVDKLMRKMTSGRFRHLPVVEDDAVIGLVSIGDIVKVRLEQLEAEASQLQDYIAGAA